MHNIYVNGKDHCPKTLSAALNVLVNCKVGKRPTAQYYESRNGVSLKNKGNHSGFRGECYNLGKSGLMDRNCPDPRK